MTCETLRIATRRSKLALWQAQTTAELLQSLGHSTEIVATDTTGDRIQKSPLALAELPNAHPARKHVSTGKGLFIKEVQDLLLSGDCSIAVHSMKDLPVRRTPGLTLAGFLPAAAPADVLVLSPDALSAWPSAEKAAHLGSSNANIFQILDAVAAKLQKPLGTTSTRRQALLRACGVSNTPIMMLRGNVDTRLDRVRANEFSAILLAEAGLRRLGLFDPQTMIPLPLQPFVPACAQGVVGIECTEGNEKLAQILFERTAPATNIRVLFERLILQALGGDCHSIIGIHAPEEAGEFFVFTAPDSKGSRSGHSSTGRWSDRCFKNVHNSIAALVPGRGASPARSYTEAFERLSVDPEVTRVLERYLESGRHLHDVG